MDWTFKLVTKISDQTDMTPMGAPLLAMYSNTFPLGSFPSGHDFPRLVTISHLQPRRHRFLWDCNWLYVLSQGAHSSAALKRAE
jgi:hypothetical protein